MSRAAFNRNCAACKHYHAMRRGRVSFEERPCPDHPNRKRPTKLSPYAVEMQMPADWRCEKFEPGRR